MTGQLVAFTAASLVVIVVPGPDLMLVLRNTARAGRAGALWTAAGIMTGLGILALAAALGITALLTATPTLFHIVRIAGGLYLIYLGIQALRSYRRMRQQHRDGADTSEAWCVPVALTDRPAPPGLRGSSFRQGLLCNLLNPKVAAFYLSLFPQFDLAHFSPLVGHTVLAAMFWMLCLLWYVGLISLIRSLARFLTSPTFARRTESLAGTALTGLGVVVLAHSG